MAKDISKDIKKAGKEIQFVMQSNLAHIADKMIEQIMVNARNSTPSTILDSTKNIKPSGINNYKSELLTALAVVSSDALDQARSEVPAAKNVKLMEKEERLLLGEFEQLPPDIRKRIKNSNDLLIGTQIADLEKAVFFQFGSSVSSEKPLKEIESDMNDKAESYINGNVISTGSRLTSANIINEVRNAFFFKDDVLNEIEGFQFMNAKPNAAICVDLSRGGGNGVIFAKDDPNHFRYTGPLHYNCDSWMRAIIKLRKDQKIEKLIPSNKKSVESIQFSDDIIKDISRYNNINMCEC